MRPDPDPDTAPDPHLSSRSLWQNKRPLHEHACDEKAFPRPSLSAHSADVTIRAHARSNVETPAISLRRDVARHVGPYSQIQLRSHLRLQRDRRCCRRAPARASKTHTPMMLANRCHRDACLQVGCLTLTVQTVGLLSGQNSTRMSLIGVGFGADAGVPAGEHNTRDAELQTARQNAAQRFDGAGRGHRLFMDAASSATRRHRAQHPCKYHPRVCGHAGAASTCHRRHYTEAVEIAVSGPYACGEQRCLEQAPAQTFVAILLFAMRMVMITHASSAWHCFSRR